MPRRLKNTLSKPFNEGYRCWLPQTQTTLVDDRFNGLRQKLRQYLAVRNLNFGPLDEVLHECVCAALQKANKGSKTHCSDGVTPVHPDDLARKAADADPRGPHSLKRGNAGADGWAWRELHLAAADEAIDKKFMDRFLGRMTCGVCQSHSRTFVRVNPPPVGQGKDELFRWTWFWHDHVNVLTKGTRITLEEARHLYHLD